MAPMLDYETPLPPTDANRRAAFWGAFALSSIVGVPFGDWVLESGYHWQAEDDGVFILSCICLIVVFAALLVLRIVAGSRVKSPLIAVACGLFGPLIGLLVLHIFVF